MSLEVNLLWVIESITAKSLVTHQDPNIFPALFATYRGQIDGDARFLCLKKWFDVILAA